MIKKIFLHIGSHKTGTSSIQKFLEQNQKSLKDDQSIAYIGGGFFPFYDYLIGSISELPLKRFDNRLKDISQDYLIISHENYSWINSDKDIKLIANKLYKYTNEVEIIIYIRRQDSLAISQKQEGTKWRDNSFVYGHELKALPLKLTPEAKAYLNFYEKIQKWSKAFGEKNIKVRIFEKDRLHNGDAVEDFTQVVGIQDYDKLQHVERVNESIARIPQLFLHQTRNYFVEDTPQKDFLVQEVVKLDFDKKDKLLPSQAEAISFYKQFKSNNQKLNEWLALSDKPFLFDDDFSHYPDKCNGSELSNDEIIEIFHKVIKGGLTNERKSKSWIEKMTQFFLKNRTYSIKKENSD